jgi:hypothetical protein
MRNRITEQSPSDNKSILLTKEEETAAVALSDVFLFNEPLEEDIRRIAKKLITTGLSHFALETLFRNDVTFLLYRNQSMINGVWGGFNEEWLITQINKRRMKRRDSVWVIFVDRIQVSLRAKSYEDYWLLIRKEMDAVSKE